MQYKKLRNLARKQRKSESEVLRPIIHEMVHLIEPNHSKSFWDIVSQYKLTERARGYLMAKGFDSEEESGGIEPAEL